MVLRIKPGGLFTFYIVFVYYDAQCVCCSCLGPAHVYRPETSVLLSPAQCTYITNMTSALYVRSQQVFSAGIVFKLVPLFDYSWPVSAPEDL